MVTAMKNSSLKENVIQFIKFNIVGIINTLVDFLVYTFLTWLGLDMLVAQCISYACGVVNSYILNTRWTFVNEKKYTGTEFLKFVCVNLVSLGVSLGILALCRDTFGIESTTLCKVIATPVTMVVNFVGNKLFVFNKNK